MSKEVAGQISVSQLHHQILFRMMKCLLKCTDLWSWAHITSKLPTPTCIIKLIYDTRFLSSLIQNLGLVRAGSLRVQHAPRDTTRKSCRVAAPQILSLKRFSESLKIATLLSTLHLKVEQPTLVIWYWDSKCCFWAQGISVSSPA